MDPWGIDRTPRQSGYPVVPHVLINESGACTQARIRCRVGTLMIGCARLHEQDLMRKRSSRLLLAPPSAMYGGLACAQTQISAQINEQRRRDTEAALCCGSVCQPLWHCERDLETSRFAGFSALVHVALDSHATGPNNNAGLAWDMNYEPCCGRSTAALGTTVHYINSRCCRMPY